MINELRKYREDRQKIKVRCPVCGKIMSGWTKNLDFDKYWIGHVVPSKKGNECWATEEQMVAVRKAWESKYEDASAEDAK
jgi:endogenous inhibitor of DNA gyrase (YacG/DUF329 family)